MTPLRLSVPSTKLVVTTWPANQLIQPMASEPPWPWLESGKMQQAQSPRKRQAQGSR